MNPAEYARLAALFDQASRLGQAARAELLRAHPDLAPHLEALLAADAAAQSTLLDQPAADIANQMLAASSIAACGPYTLEARIGEGGAGVVYRGRRSDLNLVAAVKVLRDAWVSPERRRRFDREQRTLASLQHPGIARFLDAGLTPDGTPWIAMELIDGLPLMQYVVSRSLPLPARLQLFQQICAAVEYAHGRAVIHRDLKPSNILVDPSGAPRLLDFGIARHLDDTDAPPTRPEFRMLTPGYAAPEQVLGQPPGIYTDVYALGVILRELAASTPAGELRAVWEKAAHPDPALRYSSAGALARDVGRFLANQPLEARPPSLLYHSRKFAARHRAKVVTAAAALALMLAMAGWFTWRLRQSRDHAIAAAARAQRLQAFLLQLFEGGDAAAGPSQGLTVETLIARGVREAGALNREPAVQGEVYETLGRMYGKLGRYQEAEHLLTQAAELNRGSPHRISTLTELALIYSEQSRLEQARQTARNAITEALASLGPSHSLTLAAQEMLGRILTEQGHYSQAITVLGAALAARAAAGDPAATAAAASALSNAHFYAGAYGLARGLAQQALSARQAAFGLQHPLVADDHISLGVVEFDTGRYAQAEKCYRQALAIRENWYGAQHPDTASAQTLLGRALVYQGKHEQARLFLEQALATQQRVFGPLHVRVASALNDLGNIHVAQQRYPQAEQCYRRMEQIYRASYGDSHYLVATAISNRGNVHLRQGDPRRAEPLFRDAVARYSTALGPTHANTAIARIRLGRALLRQKRWRESAAESRAGYDLLSQQVQAPVSWLQGAREDLAAAYRQLGDAQQSRRFQDEFTAAARK
jgi:serine/threonine-protein kinase